MWRPPLASCQDIAFWVTRHSKQVMSTRLGSPLMIRLKGKTLTTDHTDNYGCFQKISAANSGQRTRPCPRKDGLAVANVPRGVRSRDALPRIAAASASGRTRTRGSATARVFSVCSAEASNIAHAPRALPGSATSHQLPIRHSVGEGGSAFPKVTASAPVWDEPWALVQSAAWASASA